MDSSVSPSVRRTSVRLRSSNLSCSSGLSETTTKNKNYAGKFSIALVAVTVNTHFFFMRMDQERPENEAMVIVHEKHTSLGVKILGVTSKQRPQRKGQHRVNCFAIT